MFAPQAPGGIGVAADAAGVQDEVRDDLRARLEAALGGAYALERELGAAGMARVFVARDLRLGRHVVVKVLHPDLAAGLSARRFEREIALAARLQHPHVVPLLSAGELDGLPYYTMPYVEGESLRARFAREGALPVGDAVRLVRELADALALRARRGRGAPRPQARERAALGRARCRRRLRRRQGARLGDPERPARRCRVPAAGAATGTAFGTGVGWRWARRPTWRRSRSRGPRRPTTGPTCTRWGSWPTRRSLGRTRSGGARRRRCWPRT
jgi:hypothetical protein